MIPVQIEKFEKADARKQAIAALATAGREPVYPMKFPSQFGEDALVWTLSGGSLDGFFIEVGAFDGYKYAATYALECLGWTGLLVEAIPERADECRARRQHSRVVHAALGATHGGEVTFTVTDDEYGGMLSYVSPTADQKRIKSKNRKVTVPLTTLDELLRDHAGGIDVAVIDVEGAELDVLAGFDLRKHRPKVLLIEDNAREDGGPIAEYMSAMPYTQVAWLKVNRVYVRDDLADAWSARLRTTSVAVP